MDVSRKLVELHGDEDRVDNILPDGIHLFPTSPPLVLMHLMMVTQIVVVNSFLNFDILTFVPSVDVFETEKPLWWH